MHAQIRIYTINKGEMDAFIEHFTQQTMPIHEQVGWNIISTFVNRPQNEFIWIRTYEDEADRDAKAKAFQDAVRAAGITLGVNVAKMEVREVEMVTAAVPA
jgi:hypothetical protein